MSLLFKVSPTIDLTIFSVVKLKYGGHGMVNTAAVYTGSSKAAQYPVFGRASLQA
jgi:hypothetical protein